MSGINFSRHNLAVRISGDGDTDILIEVGDNRKLRLREDDIARPKLLQSLQHIQRLLEDAHDADEYQKVGGDPQIIRRTTLEITDRKYAEVPWELLFRSPRLRQPVVRISHVFPQTGALPMTLPLRILSAGSGRNLDHVVRRTFGHHQYEQAVETASCSLDDLEHFEQKSGWPTAEVIVVDQADPRTISPRIWPVEKMGTAAWWARLSNRLQTRLLVFGLDLQQPSFIEAFVLAWTLGTIGGPAVVLSVGPIDDQFFDALIHDQPLDLAVPGLDAEKDPRVFLFGGGGREESLRVSRVADRVIVAEPTLFKTLTTIHGAGSKRLEEISDGFRDLHHKLDSFVFNIHEGDGLVPLSRSLENLRGSSGLQSKIPLKEVRARASAKQGERFVNTALARIKPDGSLERMPVQEELSHNEIVQLELWIGELDRELFTFDALPILEEVFKWEDDKDGVWLEVAVTGIDFKVLGAPLRELWLPKIGPTEPLYFAITPKDKLLAPGVARARVTIYYNNYLIQSTRVAVAVREPGTNFPLLRLARALDLPIEKLERADPPFYASRHEFGSAKDIETADRKPARTISIFANDAEGATILTVKGTGFHAEARPDGIKDKVSAAREKLEQISNGNKQPDANRPDLDFFAFSAGQNLDQTLGDALKTLAEEGWRLYSTLIQAGARPMLQMLLDDPKATVQIGHLLVKDVVPWALIYDREYDARRKKVDGLPAEHVVCPAALKTIGDDQPNRCGLHAECALNPANIQLRKQQSQTAVNQETVVCAHHFWGFRNVLELPIRQALNKQAYEEYREVSSGKVAQVVIGLSEQIASATAHKDHLETLFKKPELSANADRLTFERDELIDHLKQGDADIVYIFCHAEQPAGQASPRLVLGKEDDQTFIEPPDLRGAPWIHHPLIFLNGCRTAGFRADVLSDFISTLAGDFQAAAIIGTEAGVWDVFAIEVAREFLLAFLNGQPAGDALRAMRRSFLQRKNPLGLAYTLYGSSDVKLKRGP